MINLNRIKLITIAAICLAAVSSSPVFSAEDPVFSNWRNVAIRGYDTVAYHLEKQPVEGEKEFTAEWNGAKWRFKSAENRDLFQSDPERWAPKYGGYCAWAVSNNYTASTVPEAWTIVDDRLYLNFSLSVQAQWRQDIPGNIKRGDANWPGVLNK